MWLELIILIKVAEVDKRVLRADCAKFGVGFRDVRGRQYYLNENSNAKLVDSSMYAEVKKTVEHWDILKLEGFYCPLPREVAGQIVELIKPNGTWWDVRWRGNPFLIRDVALIHEETDGEDS